MVRRVFGFYLLRSIYGELRDRSHHIIVYFDLGFLHCLEDTKTSFSTLSSDLKI